MGNIQEETQRLVYSMMAEIREILKSHDEFVSGSEFIQKDHESKALLMENERLQQILAGMLSMNKSLSLDKERMSILQKSAICNW